MEDNDLYQRVCSDKAVRNESKALPQHAINNVDAYSKQQRIPLDPGNGGRSIGVSSLLIGDIILSTTSNPSSQAIRAVTDSEVSHAILYIGDNLVVEAILDGVVMRSVDEALRDASVAAAFRHQELDGISALKIKDFAGKQIGKKYDFIGVGRNPFFKLNVAAFCSNKKGEDYDSCTKWLGSIYLGKWTKNRFFCSELVIACYNAAGVEIVKEPPKWVTPNDLTELHFKEGILGYVGHLRFNVK